ncbi:MAG: tagaturonate epimerase family protein [Chloroflexota bacterium]|nr:tagaturonate epimerase family protein [Chloroflexota bacterium]
MNNEQWKEKPGFSEKTWFLKQLTGLTVYPRSVVDLNGTSYLLARSGEDKYLVVLGDTIGFEGKRVGPDLESPLLCPLTTANGAALRARLDWLRPVPLGLRTSAGFGDRLGPATPGHVRAARQFETIAPIFAQQSVRENARTGRTPQQVMDDATWGLFQEGWREPWGADADHLKTPEVVDGFVAAGYTFFTVDPGDHVDNKAHTAPPTEVEVKVRALPWDMLEDTARDMERRYLTRPFDLEEGALTFEREVLWRAAAKYGHAVAHAARMYRYLFEQAGENRFEFEVSVDETETPTSPEEHFFIANELRRLEVRWISLAPRFIGRFEKGVDYIGDLDTFSAEFARHAAVARALGPYKISIHSGSDKFSIYPIAARLADGLVHVKTAGTSYLEALRAVAQIAPAFFREILSFARQRYDTDRATYHVSAQLTNVPPPINPPSKGEASALSETDLPDLLEQFDARQVLHVTFGSVLDQFGDRLLATLRGHEEVYYALLESHFRRHLAPFAECKRV